MAMETMKRIKVDENAADKVGSSNDLITEILLRLPVRSVLRFMSVSKRFHFLISNTSFRLLHTKRHLNPPSGLFVPTASNKPHQKYAFIPFDINHPFKAPFVTPSFAPNVERIVIKHSCNGLMLCYGERIELTEDGKCVLISKYYLYNPTVNQFTTLPRFETDKNSYICGVTLIFDPSKSPYYRIVYVFRSCFGKMLYQIGIYSSQTRTCKTSYEFSLDDKIHVYFDAGVYLNNVIHWIHKSGFVLSFNTEEFFVFETQTPFALEDLNVTKYLDYLFESRDHLLFARTRSPLSSALKIYELKSGSSTLIWEQTPKYVVDLNQVARSFPEILKPLFYENRFNFDILAIVLGEKEDGSFLVLGIPGKAVRYNLVSKTFHKLGDFLFSPAQNSHALYSRGQCGFPFVESLHSV